MKSAYRNFRFQTLVALAFLGLCAILGGFFPTTAKADETQGAKTMIIYYSWSGNTKSIANLIHQKVGGDIVELELGNPYPSDYNACTAQAKKDQQDGARPELKTQIRNLDRYDVIYLGYPNWWSSVPMPIATLLESYNFSGKTIIPFCSHGGGGLGRSVRDIAAYAPEATVKEALSVYGGGKSSLSEDIDEWLSKNK